MNPQVLKGFRDYGPEEMFARQQMLDKVRGVFESFGYMPLHTPALEFAEILLGKYGVEGEKLLYQFEDQGGRRVALRYDLTVPLARYVAMNPNIRFPFRRYQIAPVWRAERPQKGRFREFFQCDVDMVGVDSALADAECVLVDMGVMNALGLAEFTVLLNHRGFLDGLLESLGIAGSAAVPVLRLLDKVDKVSRDDLAAMLTDAGLSPGQVDTLAGLSGVAGSNRERLEHGKTLSGGNPTALSALDRLGAVLDAVEESLAGRKEKLGGSVVFAPWVARGLDYYTGVVYETFLPPRFGIGSVMSGGRYDKLLGSMSGRDVPAVGISLGIDRLASALAGEEGTKAGAVTVLVCTLEGAQQHSVRVAAALRESLAAVGASVELFPEAARLKKQLDYANAKGMAVVVIAGPDEVARGVVSVKSMVSGEQVEALAAEVGAAVERLVK